MPALSALSDTVSRCGPQPVKQNITWVPVRASGCETDHYLGSDDGPQAVKQTIIVTWVPTTASGCETDHYLGSDDGPQAVKQTITWVLMTGLKL